MKKLRSISVLCALVMALSCFAAFPAVAATPEWAESGDGLSAETAYIIKTAEQFHNFWAAMTNASTAITGYYKLGADIVLNTGDASEWGDDAPTKYVWTCPIGNGKDFSGVFDGAGYTISGIYLKSSTTSTKAALFAVIAGTVKNLKIKNSYFECIAQSGYVESGSFAGRLKGTVENCYSDAIITNNATPASSNTNPVAIGGIVGAGFADVATVKNCVFDGKILNSVGYVGGILGRANTTGATIENCINLGYINSNNNDSVGGIFGNGYQVNVTIKNCMNLSNDITDYKETPGELIGGAYSANSTYVKVENFVTVEGYRTTRQFMASDGNKDYCANWKSQIKEISLGTLLSEDVTKESGALAGWTYRAGSFPMPPKGEGNVDLELNLLLGLKFKGAAVRLDIDTGVKSGIRFSTTIDTDMLETLKNAGATIEGYGTYITVKEAIVGKDYDFTPDVLANKGWRCLDVTATELFEGTRIAGTIASVAVNSQEYISRAYVKFTIGGVTYTHLADYDDSNVRSVSFVAEAALDDFSDEYDEEKYKYEVVVSGVTKYSPYSTEQRQYLDTLK